MNFKTILMPKVILAKCLSQKNYYYRTYLTEVRFNDSYIEQQSSDVVMLSISMSAPWAGVQLCRNRSNSCQTPNRPNLLLHLRSVSLENRPSKMYFRWPFLKIKNL